MQTASNTKMSFIVSPSTIRISEALLIGWMMQQQYRLEVMLP